MRSIACLLLMGVMFRHFTAVSIGSNTYLGSKGWFYTMGGLWEVVLCAGLFLVVWEAKKTKWRWVALYALGIGICEALQMAACRVLVADISKVSGNLCDFATGLPVTATMNALYLLFLAVTIGVLIREQQYK